MEKNIFNYWIVCTMKMEKMRIETDTMIKGLGFKDIKSALLPCFIRRLLPKITNFHTCEFASMYIVHKWIDFYALMTFRGNLACKFTWLITLLYQKLLSTWTSNRDGKCNLFTVNSLSTAYSVYRACLILQSIRWRFFYLNGTFYRGITKPFFLL